MYHDVAVQDIEKKQSCYAAPQGRVATSRAVCPGQQKLGS